eukprot:gene20743-27562_t
MEVEDEPRLSILDSFVDVKGACTEVLTIHATDGPPQFQVLVVPGNPGNASFYKPFIHFLHQEFEGHAEILSISHPGHDKGPQNTPHGKLWDLKEQVQHKVDFMREYCLKPGKPPLIVAAHSIGAYMMLKACRTVELEMEQLNITNLPKIVKVVGLMPFFETDFKQARQKILRTLASGYETIGYIAAALGCLPHSVQEWFIHNCAEDQMDVQVVNTTKELLNQASIRNNL